jgi:hypothetical protein
MQNSVLSGNKMSIQTGRPRTVELALSVSQIKNKTQWKNCDPDDKELLKTACVKLDFHDKTLSEAYLEGNPGSVLTPPNGFLPTLILFVPVHTQANQVPPNKLIWCLCRLRFGRFGDRRPTMKVALPRLPRT